MRSMVAGTVAVFPAAPLKGSNSPESLTLRPQGSTVKSSPRLSRVTDPFS
jgi:hypothetical protein